MASLRKSMTIQETLPGECHCMTVTRLFLDLEKVFNSGAVPGFAASFLAGILASFSPCIYPLIPVTLGVIGAASAKSRVKGFRISLIFVLGIAVTYTVLGAAAAMAGSFLSRLFMNPWAWFLMAVLFILLGLSMWDLIRLDIFFPVEVPSGKATGFFIFVMGMVSAFALAPCNFPVLGAILSLIAAKGDLVYGGICLFLFSLGYGTILIVLGTFVSLIERLPKQGRWLIIIRRLLGSLLVFMGGYFIVKAMIILKTHAK
jgi:cytochrome c biogenesis protein CcdA